MDHEARLDKAIREAYAKGLTYRNIQEMLSVSPNRIYQVINHVEINHHRGRPPQISKEHYNFIETNFLLNARLTDSQMVQMLKEKFGITISRSQICRIRNNFNIKYRRPIVIQKLTGCQKMQRVQFCSEMLSKLHDDSIIIFSDESRFAIGNDCDFVRYRTGEWNKTACIEKEKFTHSVRFWGASARGWKSKLIKCSNGVGTSEYREIIEKSGVITELDKKFGRFKYEFMQDGAPCHTADETISFLSRKCKIFAG